MNAVSVAAKMALATILLFSLVTLTTAAPALPCEFYGTVLIDGQPAPVGAIVVAKINDEERGQIVVEKEGVYGGPGTFDQRLKVVVEASDISSGTPAVTFWINGIQAKQTSEFSSGQSIELNLNTGAGSAESPEASSESAPTIIPDENQVADVIEEQTSAPALESNKDSVEEVSSVPSDMPPMLPEMMMPVEDFLASITGGKSDSSNVSNDSAKTTIEATSQNDETVEADAVVKVDFSGSPASGSAPLTVSFRDLSSGIPTKWYWDFGDGSSSDGQNPTHVYETDGYYSVTLTASNAYNSASATKKDYIKITPVSEIVADFSASPQSGQVPLSVKFNDLSTGIPTSWNWDFGDGSTSKLQNPTHEYTNVGLYTVRLTASNSAGSSVITKAGFINAYSGGLKAAFTADPQSGQAPLSVAFIDQSSGNPTIWAWDFGDGVTDSVKNPVHIYENKGYYTVSLKIKNNDGLNNTLKRENYIYVGETGGLVTDFSASTLKGNSPLTVSFTDLSSGNPTIWAWDFGDGTGDIIQNPVHIYEAEGKYTVSLTTANGNGDFNTKTEVDYITVGNVEPTPVPTHTPIAVPYVPETFYGSVLMYGIPIQSGGQVEARVVGKDISDENNPITTAKLYFGKGGTFTPKLQVQGVEPGTAITFYVGDAQNQLTKAYILDEEGNYLQSIPFEPGIERELSLELLKNPPTIINPIPVPTQIESDCPGVPTIPMTLYGDAHVTTGEEYISSITGECVNCDPNIKVGAKIEARIAGYDVSGPANPLELNSTGYYGGGNSSWGDKLSVQGKCITDPVNMTFWVMDAGWQKYVQAWVKNGEIYSREVPFNPGKTTKVNLWVGNKPTKQVAVTPTPTPASWQPQKFYGKVEFNGYPLREGDRVMATTEGVDLTGPTNPLEVVKFGEYGNPSDEMLIVDVPYDKINQTDPISFWIKPSEYEFWYKAEVTSPISDKWQSTYPFTPGSITSLNLRSYDRSEFKKFYNIASEIKNVILPEDCEDW